MIKIDKTEPKTERINHVIVNFKLVIIEVKAKIIDKINEIITLKRDAIRKQAHKRLLYDLVFMMIPALKHLPKTV